MVAIAAADSPSGAGTDGGDTAALPAQGDGAAGPGGTATNIAATAPASLPPKQANPQAYLEPCAAQQQQPLAAALVADTLLARLYWDPPAATLSPSTAPPSSSPATPAAPFLPRVIIAALLRALAALAFHGLVPLVPVPVPAPPPGGADRAVARAARLAHTMVMYAAVGPHHVRVTVRELACNLAHAALPALAGSVQGSALLRSAASTRCCYGGGERGGGPCGSTS